MSNEEIISVIDELALGAEECANDYDYTGRARKAHARKAKALRAAIEKLRTQPDNQPNEPLTLEELREMDGQPVWMESDSETGWGILVVCGSGTLIMAKTGKESYVIYSYDRYNEQLGAKLYRRPPKEEK